jgi:hypothetical protein
MATSISWKITRLEIINKDGLSDVAIQSCFDVSGVDANDKRGFAQGDVLLQNPDPSTFTPISEVTEEQAIAWTKAALGDRVAFYENMVADQIASQYVEKPQAADLPWITPADSTAADAA